MATTRLGRWATGLFVASLILLATLIVAYNTDALGVFEQRTAGGLALWVVAAIAAVGTLVTGAVSWLRFKDRSVVVVVATVYAVLATVLLAMGAIPEN
jgi:hypothetical protein